MYHATLLAALPLWHRSNPASRDLNPNDHGTNNVEHLGVIGTIIPEDDREDDATKVTASTSEARHNTISVRVNVRHKGVVEPVGALEEESQTTRDQTDEGGFVPRVRDADNNAEHAGHDAVDVEQDLLGPHRSRLAVGKVAHHTAEGPHDDVEQAEDGSEVARFLEAEAEVALVVVAEDGVDGELGAKGAEVGGAGDEGGSGEDDAEHLAEAGLLNDFAAGNVDHLLLAHLDLAVVEDAAVLRLVDLLLFVADVAAGWGPDGVRSLGHVAWDGHDGALGGVGAEVVLGGLHAVGPAAGGGVGAEEDEADGGGGDDDAGDDEGHSPGDVG